MIDEEGDAYTVKHKLRRNDAKKNTKMVKPVFWSPFVNCCQVLWNRCTQVYYRVFWR